jgi:hypothetical protein
VFWTTAICYPFGIFIVMAGPAAYRAAEKLNLLAALSFIFYNSSQFLLPGLFLALMFGFDSGGGKACIQHLCLRFVLWQSGIPWNLAQFLDYCVERRLLLRVGGRYRFLHRELLEHFAQSRHV